VLFRSQIVLSPQELQKIPTAFLIYMPKKSAAFLSSTQPTAFLRKEMANEWLFRDSGIVVFFSNHSHPA
jgi:hypothetical protein